MRDFREQNRMPERAIKARSVLLIDGEGKNLGVIDTREAYRMAESVGLDLVQVGDGKNDIPVCKIIDLGKWKYEQAKKKKASKPVQQETKEIKIRPNTGEHDLEYRAKQAVDFLKEGSRVRILIRFKGRERTHMIETGKAALEKFLSMIEQDKYKIEKAPDITEKDIAITMLPVK